MDGRYQINDYKQYLTRWVDKAIESKSWERNEDLHLDEIDTKFKKMENWLFGSIYFYEIITDIIIDKPFSCLLVIQLSYSENMTNFEDLSWNCLNELFDLTPPSYYLFPHGNINLGKTLKDLTPIANLSKELGYQILFKEEKESEGEYFRCLYINVKGT